MKRVLIIIGLSAVHFLITMGFGILNFSAGISNFDNIDKAPSASNAITNSISNVLEFPLLLLFRTLELSSLGEFLPKFIFIAIANSILWGTAIYIIYKYVIKKPEKTRQT